MLNVGNEKILQPFIGVPSKLSAKLTPGLLKVALSSLLLSSLANTASAQQLYGRANLLYQSNCPANLLTCRKLDDSQCNNSSLPIKFESCHLDSADILRCDVADKKIVYRKIDEHHEKISCPDDVIFKGIFNELGEINQGSIKHKLLRYESYKGHWHKGLPHGNGTKFDDRLHFITFTGHYKDGKRHGWGKQFSKITGEKLCEGFFEDDKFKRGIIYNRSKGNVQFQGTDEWAISHQGKVNTPEFGEVDVTLEGTFKEFNDCNGYGTLIGAGINLDGKGIRTEYQNNEIVRQYVGDFQESHYRNSIIHGQSTEYVRGKKTYSGGFDYGQRHGFGTEYVENENAIFAGNFDHGVKTGFGTEFHPQRGTFHEEMLQTCAIKNQGNYEKNLRHGIGTEFDSQGNIVLEGIWQAGSYLGTPPGKNIGKPATDVPGEPNIGHIGSIALAISGIAAASIFCFKKFKPNLTSLTVRLKSMLPSQIFHASPTLEILKPDTTKPIV